MENDFELVEKSEISNLREENKKLKSSGSLENLDPKIIQELSELLAGEAKKERLLVLKGLEEIKELNKQTLNSVLTKTEAMQFKMEDLVDNLTKLVETVSLVVKGESGAVTKEDHKTL